MGEYSSRSIYELWRFMDSALRKPVEIRLDRMTIAGRINYIKLK